MRAIAVLLCLLLPGCLGALGGEERSEWAYEMTQLDLVDPTGLGVTVAIVDTGINVAHPSLDHLVDGDASNGELVGYKDFLTDREGVTRAADPNGHGSHVAGIISARGSSVGDKIVYGGVDLLGGAPDVRLVVARVCDEDSCDSASIADAIDWAVNKHRAQVLSLSLGGRNALPQAVNEIIRTDIENAINRAIDQGVVVVAAAGNSGPESDDVDAPADIPGVIAVGAVDADRRMADFSNRGDNPACRGNLPFGGGRCDPHKKPELVAPGVGILSAWTDESYVEAGGTSQATPFVTSVVAVMLEGKSRLDARADVNHLKRILMDTAAPIPSQAVPHDDLAGYGVVQAQLALQAYG